jgi:predicted nuclease of predicted toxin-antitoxin system
MPNNIRFYLDESVHSAVAEGLRHREIDILTTPEAGNMGTTDEEQLAFATAESRVLVSQDSDFLVLHSQGIQHSGIVYYKAQTRSIKQILRGLVMLYEVSEGETMMNHVEYL